MHFVSGGSYNGKANWVKNYYQLASLSADEYKWISAYKDVRLPECLLHINANIIILEGIEQWTLQIAKENEVENSLQIMQSIIDSWRKWQADHRKQLVVIGTDISKGIVPVDYNLRKWRDVTGFAYQYIIQRSSMVHRIWYGISQQLK